MTRRRQWAIEECRWKHTLRKEGERRRRPKWVLAISHLELIKFIQITMWATGGQIQIKTWCKRPYAGVDYNLTLYQLQSRLQHMYIVYHGQPYARVDLNPMTESTLKVLSSGNWGGSKWVSIDPIWQTVWPASVLYLAPMDTITRGT